MMTKEITVQEKNIPPRVLIVDDEPDIIILNIAMNNVAYTNASFTTLNQNIWV
jgi:hypothetical protein